MEHLAKHTDLALLLSSVDYAGRTCIELAVAKDRIAVVQVLLDRGVDINRRIAEGSYLHLAALRKHKRVAYLLLDRGIDVDIINVCSMFNVSLACSLTSFMVPTVQRRNCIQSR
jgi:ankyrin repeat protein